MYSFLFRFETEQVYLDLFVATNEFALNSRYLSRKCPSLKSWTRVFFLKITSTVRQRGPSQDARRHRNFGRFVVTRRRPRKSLLRIIFVRRYYFWSRASCFWIPNLLIVDLSSSKFFGIPRLVDIRSF